MGPRRAGVLAWPGRQLRKIDRKLGVHSRVELSEALQRRRP